MYSNFYFFFFKIELNFCIFLKTRVYPFYETSYFASKSKEIHEALKSLNPFKVTLSQFGYFTHKGLNFHLKSVHVLKN